MVVQMADCLVCDRIDQIRNGENPHFIAELETGYVVAGDHQFFKGYTLFLCKQHVPELHQLDKAFKLKFLTFQPFGSDQALLLLNQSIRYNKHLFFGRKPIFLRLISQV